MFKIHFVKLISLASTLSIGLGASGCASLKWAEKAELPPTAPATLVQSKEVGRFEVTTLDKRPKTSREKIKLRLDAYANRFMACQKKFPVTKSSSVDLKFVIERSGQVATARATNSSLGIAALDQCLVSVVKSMRFHAGNEKHVMEVRYPLSFQVTSAKNLAGYHEQELERQKNLKKAAENRRDKKLTASI